ncbi:NAD-dependent epimerase/dehydratase family protein [Pelagovum pacificum]|uniref:NAD-dependent epimerase/dehydratase family protein n=1 Tax=Pelagovum pacificum TaxID=2588711 RepID=A0A5C5GAG9_9RHOB|nr:NAD-dependent epimerase/dehydratase family protein [Pelagovum pacificum]QQA45038.1 NAD-dependent epimerase/dehydratase family protein [Pelagovum pacificum]TNY31553.1 NAD-dependent epimerase/dehydratase family protein [Pelagovum pacificum]
MSEHAIFITGAAGYVGRNLLRHFIAKGRRVIGLVRNAEAADRVRAWGGEPVLGDMLSADLAPLMSSADTLIHAAASVDHGAGSAAAVINPEGTRRVLEAARQANIEKAIHISTDSVLQDGRPLCNVDESTPYPSRPAGAYSAGKAEAERIALRAAASGQHVVTLRPRMVWGRDDTTALPTLVGAAQSGQFGWISGGGYRSSTLHIANLCHAVELALERGASGEIYHVSDGPARTFRETVTGLLESQRIEVPTKTVPRGVLRNVARLGDGLHRVSGGRWRGPMSFQDFATSAVEITLNIHKAQRDLGYVPVMSWEDGLAELSGGGFSDT